MDEQRTMDHYPELPEGKGSFDRMIQGLRRKDPELNTMCSGVLLRTHTEAGVNVVPRLVIEAASSGKQPGHRVRILDVIQRIGQPLGADDFFTVMALASHHVEEVASKAAEVIAALRPRSNQVTAASVE